MICRIWAAVASMACPHGCRPAGGWLSEADGQILLLRAMQVGASIRERKRLQWLIDRIRRNPDVSKRAADYVRLRASDGVKPWRIDEVLDGLVAQLSD